MKVILNDQMDIISEANAANVMNQYYTNVGTQPTQKFSNNALQPESNFPKVNRVFDSQFRTEKEIRQLVKELDRNKSSVVAKLNTKLLLESLINLILKCATS